MSLISFNIFLSSLLLLPFLTLSVVSQNVVEEVKHRNNANKLEPSIEVTASVPQLSVNFDDRLINHESRKVPEKVKHSFGSHTKRLVGTVAAPSSHVSDSRIQSIEKSLQDRPNYGPRRAVIVKPLMRSSLIHIPIKIHSTNNVKKLSKSPSKEQEQWNISGSLTSSVDFPYTRRKLFGSTNVERSTIISVKARNKIKSATNARSEAISLNSSHKLQNELASFSSASANVVDSDSYATETPKNVASTKGFILQEWTTEAPEKSSNPAVFDYHNRTPSPLKKYKFTQKLRQRPRLRIRRPNEAQHGEHTSSLEQALSLPQLTPFLPSESHEKDLNTELHSQKRKNGEKSAFYGGDELHASADKKVENPVTDGESSGKTSFGSFGGGSGAVFGGGSGKMPPSGIDFSSGSFGIVNDEQSTTYSPPKKIQDAMEETSEHKPEKESGATGAITDKMKSETEELFVIPQNSGLRPAAPPPEFQGGFGSGSGGSSFGSKPETFQSGPSFGNSNGVAESSINNDDNNVDSSFFTGESALTPNNRGPTGDGYGPPLYPGAAIPPPVPAVNVGGSAAGIPPPYQVVDATQNPPTTLKPSALFNVLSKADLGFNQAMTHFERGTPVESAAIDILEVALGSQKLDSQARLLGHVDRAIGIGNLQRLQRWANTGGALDSLKEQLARFLKNFSPPEHLLPTIPPQLSHLFSSSK